MYKKLSTIDNGPWKWAVLDIEADSLSKFEIATIHLMHLPRYNYYIRGEINL